VGTGTEQRRSRDKGEGATVNGKPGGVRQTHGLKVMREELAL
jgi:hypothetical protein